MLARQVAQASSYLTLGELAFAATVQGFLAATLALGNASHIAIADLALAPGAAIVPPGTQPVTLRAEFSVSPASMALQSQVGALRCSMREGLQATCARFTGREPIAYARTPLQWYGELHVASHKQPSTCTGSDNQVHMLFQLIRQICSCPFECLGSNGEAPSACNWLLRACAH